MPSPLKYDRVFNFSAGPANLPQEVLEQVRDEMMNYHGCGMSVMEMSHRSKFFDEIMAKSVASARDLMKLGDDYAILFLQGGASLQFAMAPMNLYQQGKPIDVIHTGYWTEKAKKELKSYESRVVASGESDGFKKLPQTQASQFNSDASYVYLCTNNTISGTQWQNIPDTGKAPLVADMSSDFLSRRRDFSRFGMIFAGAQKNLGPSGVCLVAIRKDLAERADAKLPTILQYRTHIKGDSRFNTPPSFGIYVCGLVMEWVQKQGGLEAVEKKNAEKAAHLYGAIDSSQIFRSPIDKASRSLMNVVFRIKPDSADGVQLEEKFIKEAKAAGLEGLKGHRSVGGLRASIYNAHPLEGVKRLVEFMREFEKRNA